MIDIHLEADCGTTPMCGQMADRTHHQLHRPVYERGAAVMEIPADVAGHLALHNTFRKRASRARRLGYEVIEVEPRDHPDEILEINRSLPERQGRVMDKAYWEYEPQLGTLPPVICSRHNSRFYGVFHPGGQMVAYGAIERRGEAVIVSQWLGHGNHLDDGIMYLLMSRVLFDAARDGAKFLFYNRWDSGTDGLRFFKARIGLEEKNVRWMLL